MFERTDAGDYKPPNLVYGGIYRQEPVRVRCSWLISDSRWVAAVVVCLLIGAQKCLLLFSRLCQSQCLADTLSALVPR